jgi:hypothetical protein
VMNGRDYLKNRLREKDDSGTNSRSITRTAGFVPHHVKTLVVPPRHV